MSSKMLMGDMPELMENILKHLNNEIYSLYSCALVNRHWCKMSIPILWQNPFSTIKQRRSLFIPIYFSSLGEDEKLVIKECLKEFEINIEFTKPLFDYARFLKVLHIYQLANKVRDWMCLKLDNQDLTYFDLRTAPLINLLFKLFVENDGGDCPKDFLGIISALESQKNTLQEVILKGCVFSAEFEVLNNCKNLETLRIFHCDKELLKILDYNISTLEISYSLIDVPIIALKSFCPNIIYLYITNIGISTQLLELICNLQKLQFLSLSYAYRLSKKAKNIRVMQFAKILPSTLQYLDIALGLLDTLLDSFIDILLDHCNAPLKKLLITSISLNYEKNTKALIRYCTRIRTLNYVGIVKYYDLDYDIRKVLEKYVTLVPYKHIVINC
ncbi:hypothetical protein C2G38_2093072 [Gigaspora rosea]|uniref:F-box domain-containing protein n=1 Tax=Gigaspora rosea TaxID=44941 RepID=A0A397V6C5_9GLOM|nr:hypothetical protein C2G38_2093072 [Gigaspora rosea]